MHNAASDIGLGPSFGTPWSVILLAGSRPGGDPLAAHFGQTSKALVPVAGRPMIAYVLDSLLSVPAVHAITVLAQQPDVLMQDSRLAPFLGDPRVTTARSGDGIASSIAALVDDERLRWPVLVTTADHPLLDPAVLGHFMAESEDCDVAVGLVSRDVVKDLADPRHRTWLRFRDDAVSGANLFALRSPAVMSALRYWSALERHRKKPWRMAAKLGPALLLQVMLGRLSLDAAFDRAGQRLGVHARAIRLPFAHAAIDVDKLADHAQVEAIIHNRRA